VSETPLDPRLRDEIERWRAATPPAPDRLANRVRAAVDRERMDVRRGTEAPRGTAMVLAWWLAAAASVALALLLGYGLLGQRGPVETVAGRLVVADALAAAEAAEREHARAIAQLQEAAAPILRRAGSPDTPPEENARLLALRERIASVDAAIAEIEGYLDTNPGLASARTMLLAAYMDKTDLLREVLALEEENEA
jgi:hypothetical protein